MAKVRSAMAMAAALAASAPAARAAEPVMLQCGRDYQAARSAGTLNGMDWNAYRAACAERLKAAPVAAAGVTPVPAAAPSAAARPEPAVAADSTPAASGGSAAMHARQKQCGAEWRAQKAALVAATPGLTWPKYWSQCNGRLKATGR